MSPPGPARRFAVRLFSGPSFEVVAASIPDVLRLIEGGQVWAGLERAPHATDVASVTPLPAYA